MNVVDLIQYRCKETIAVLRYVLKLSIAGDVEGIVICFRAKGKDEFAFTGIFSSDPAPALKAANRISWRMNQAVDAMESTF